MREHVASSCRIVALFTELLGPGGVQQAGRLTAVALSQIASRRGWQVEFLSLNDPLGPHRHSWNGTEVLFRGFGRKKARFAVAAMVRASNGTRIALASHPHLAPIAAQMGFLRPRLKIAVVSHGVEVWQRLPTFRRKAFLKADLFIAPSRYTVEQVIRIQGAPREKTKCMPWPVDPGLLDMAENPDTLPLPPGFPQRPVLLATARLAAEERYKGLDQLIRAVARLTSKLPALHLAIVGSGDDVPRHEQLARELNLTDRVRFFHGLSQREIAGCYSRCDAFALPSTGEGFGFVFLEAMAFGKPVIGAAAGGVTDIVEHEQNGLLVAANDLDQLVQAIERLFTTESLGLELGRKGSSTVRSKFRFDLFRSQLDDALWTS